MSSFTVKVPPGSPLPNPAAEIAVRSTLTDILYNVKVEKITELRWLDNGHLLVSGEGKKRGPVDENAT